MTSAFPSQRLKIRFLPAVPGTDAKGSAIAAKFWFDQAKIQADIALQANETKVDKAGSTMTGLLVLSGPPVAALNPATKAYTDAADTANTSLANTKVPLAGGTMTGFLTLSGDPTALLHAASKQYTDNADALKLNLTGGTLTGSLILPSALPTNPLQAVTKQYVDGAGVGVYQPLDNDLTSIANQTVNGTWYFRKADGVYAPVIVGSNLTLNTTTGRLDAVGASGGTGDVSSLGDTFSTNALAAYADGTGDAIRAMNLGPGLSIGGAAVPAAGTLSLDNELVALAGTTAAADQLPYFTSPTAATTTTLTAAARTLLDDASTAAMLTTLGAAPATGGSYLPLAGGTLTGDLTLSKTQPLLILNKTVSGAAGPAAIIGKSVGLTRWEMDLGNSTVEGGSNAGSDFTLARFNDAGSVIDSPLTISRANGAAVFAGAVTVNGAALALGDVTINKVQPLLILNKAAAGQTSGIQTKMAGLPRWQMNLGGTGAESGADAGSDFELVRSHDNGTQIDLPLTISRSTGIAAFTQTPTALTPAALDNSTKVATTAWVNGNTSRTGQRVLGLKSAGGGSATLYNFQFYEATFTNASGLAVVQRNGSFNISTGTVGAGGRDTALNNGDVHFYAIWGSGPGVAGIVSNQLPSVGPSPMPSGYTHWCYLTSVKYSGGNLAVVRVVGNKCFYAPYDSYGIAIGGNTGDGGWVDAGYAGLVPVIASAVQAVCGANASANAAAGMFFYWGSSTAQGRQKINYVAVAFDGSSNNAQINTAWFPNFTDQIIGYGWATWFNLGNLTGSGQSTYVIGYEVPNGS